MTHYGLPLGKFTSEDNAISYSGDDISNNSETLASETIVINLASISSDISRLIVFVNSPDISFPFHKLPYFTGRLIGITSDGQEQELGLYESPQKPERTNIALIFPYIEKNQNSWSLLGDFSTSNYSHVGQTISSLLDKNKIVDCPDTLNNREKTYRINDVHFTVGEDDGKVGSVSKAILYGSVVSFITAFLRFYCDFFYLENLNLIKKIWFTLGAYCFCSYFPTITVQRTAIYKSKVSLFISGLLILASIFLSHLISIFYVESTQSISMPYIEYIGSLTWWQWVSHIVTIVLVPLFVYDDLRLEIK